MSILSKLAIKNMKFNKKRTTVSIIAITLSCMMIFMICFSFSTYRECQKQNIINLEGDYHVLVSNIKYESINNFDNEYIEKYLVYSNTKIKYNSEDEHFGDTLVKADINYLKNLNITSGRIPNNDKEILLNDENCIINNNIIINSSEYKIVGCIKSSNQRLYTLYEFDTKDDINVLLYYKNLKDLRSKTIQLVSDLPEIKNNPLLSGFAESKIEYNSNLLSYYGSPVDSTGILNNAFYNVMVLITCTIVGVFILLVVYNTYSISVIERKRSFAVLSSVGATKFQVIKTLMFEALIELLIGITLGFIISYGIFNIIIQVLNSIFYKNLVFNIHIPYLLICIAILLIFVLLSSIMPSIEASYINCISVIRGNNDIKNKKLKKSIFDFNIESSIAHKNIKINKRKYGATTFCIVLSFVFIYYFFYIFQFIKR